MRRKRVMKKLKCKKCNGEYNAMNEFKDPSKAGVCWNCFVQKTKDDNSKAKLEAEAMYTY